MDISISRRQLLATLATTPLLARASAQTADVPTAAAAAPAVGAAPIVEEVPYVQTPPHVVHRMLQLTDLAARDVVWDLGSGDGRIVITAAKKFGARAVGYEIDPALIRESRELALQADVSGRTRFEQKDLFTLAFSEPSVVTMYLLPEFNLKLRPLLLAQMRPGSRVISHEWDMGDWRPDETLIIPSNEKPYGTARENRVMLWVIPAPVAGEWRLSTPDVRFTLTQRLQDVTATASQGKVLWASLRGTELAIAWQDGSKRSVFRGEVRGKRWQGRVQRLGTWANTQSGPPVYFTATLV